MNVEPLNRSVADIGVWNNLPFFNNGEFETVRNALSNDKRTIFPAADKVLRAFRSLQPSKVRVLILGQDPYPNEEHATGLAFGVPAGTTRLLPSLRNIFAKVKAEFGDSAGAALKLKNNCELTGWAKQGVPLLNTILTVPEWCPNGHKNIGWKPLIEQATEKLAKRADIAWRAFGQPAKKHLPGNLKDQEFVICTRHPSRGLPKQCHPFSGINKLLGNRPIDWLNT